MKLCLHVMIVIMCIPMYSSHDFVILALPMITYRVHHRDFDIAFLPTRSAVALLFASRCFKRVEKDIAFSLTDT